MLTKEKVRKTIDKLPENFIVDQVVEKLVVLNKPSRQFPTRPVVLNLYLD